MSKVFRTVEFALSSVTCQTAFLCVINLRREEKRDASEETSGRCFNASDSRNYFFNRCSTKVNVTINA